jgi:outer membrane protein assembly factor BamB
MAVAFVMAPDSQAGACSPNLVPHNRFGTISAVALLILANAHWVNAQSSGIAVTTYHYNNHRTGWNQSESTLTPTKISHARFGILYTVALDERVDAQPLVVPGVNVTAGNFQGRHDVVYVATANNTVYMIDADYGTVLWSQNFGNPVSRVIGCYASGAIGINSTPVIDIASRILYIMAYTNDTSGPTYRIHALDLGNLAEKLSPQVVSASHTLLGGSQFVFNAKYQKQRPGLLLANGNVYAGFGSFCDDNPSLSRGWLLGWNAASLAPLASNQLVDAQSTSPHSFFLSSIWMSGYGLAADDSGNLLFVTGNSDPGTYDGVTNLQESVVKVSPDLSSVLDLFTPSNQISLDQSDTDFGSGGVMVLPDQSGSIPHLAVAAGKYGTMFLMNEDNLGGYSPHMNNVLGSYSINGGCWCGESYFVDPDGAARVVSSGYRYVIVWKLATLPSPTLSKAGTAMISWGPGYDGGFFTTISSKGMASPVIWALSRPVNQNILLYAFDPDSQQGGVMTQLFQGIAGSWPIMSANSNLVPVVANGKVYVASYKQLTIFGFPSAH